MKVNSLWSKILVTAIVAVLGFIIDIYFAHWVYHNYEPVVKGILGISLLVMIYRYIFPKGLSEDSIRFSFTTTTDILKFIFFNVYMIIAGYWALKEFSDMVFYLVKLFKNN